MHPAGAAGQRIRVHPHGPAPEVDGKSAPDAEMPKASRWFRGEGCGSWRVAHLLRSQRPAAAGSGRHAGSRRRAAVGAHAAPTAGSVSAAGGAPQARRRSQQRQRGGQTAAQAVNKSATRRVRRFAYCLVSGRKASPCWPNPSRRARRGQAKCAEREHREAVKARWTGKERTAVVAKPREQERTRAALHRPAAAARR